LVGVLGGGGGDLGGGGFPGVAFGLHAGLDRGAEGESPELGVADDPHFELYAIGHSGPLVDVAGTTPTIPGFREGFHPRQVCQFVRTVQHL
jgi:hypothetical protein